jgi:hypothetical protein
MGTIVIQGRIGKAQDILPIYFHRKDKIPYRWSNGHDNIVRLVGEFYDFPCAPSGILGLQG